MEYHVFRKRDIRKLIFQLRNHRLVEYVGQHHDNIAVKFKTGIREKWYHKDILRGRLFVPNSPLLGPNCIIKQEYQTFIDQEDDDSFILTYPDWYHSNFLSQRLIIQELIELCMKFVPKYRQEMLFDDLQKIRPQGTDFGKIIRLFIGNRSGRLITNRFDNFSSYTRDIRILYKVIVRLLHVRKDVRISEIIRVMTRNFVSPSIYLTLFRTLRIGGLSVADPYPTIPKMLAATIANMRYFSPVINKELESFLNTKFNLIDKNKEYDILLLDGNFEDEVSSDLISKYQIKYSAKLKPCLRSFEIYAVKKCGYLMVENGVKK